MVSSSSERGSSLIVAILACALLATAVGILIQDLNDRQRLFRHEARVISLAHLGDAALAETLAELALDPDFPGLAPRPIDSGVMWSRVQPISQASILVVAEAELDGWRGLLEAEVAMGPKGPSVSRWERAVEPAQGSSRLLRRKSTSLR